MTNKISRKILITTSVKNQFFGIFIILCVLRINVDTKDVVYLFLYFVIFLGRTLSSVMLKKLYFAYLILRFHVCFCVYVCTFFNSCVHDIWSSYKILDEKEVILSLKEWML